MRTSNQSGTSATNTLGWAVFLGVSWTWCIGMFLPVLLVRDYGPLGWVIFAIPNVIGAAAMGWMLRRPQASEELVTAHRPLCVAFSVVTLAFHILFAFFVVYLASARTMGIIVAAFVVIFVLGEWRRRADVVVAPLVWLTSIAMLIGVYLASNDVMSIPMGHASANLYYLIPVMLLGFALCPYLDLTFHRARRSLTPRGARVAFGLGFGFFFLVMIAGTLLYTPALATVVTFGNLHFFKGPTLAAAIALHLGVQSAFTVSVHVRELRRSLQWAILPILVCALVAGACYPFFGGNGMNWFEGSYRAFLGFYGLVFPAYVWICMIPSWRTPEAPSGRSLWVWAGCVVLASPMYWMGFIRKDTIWLLPGVAVVLLGRLLIRRPVEKAA